MPKLSRRTKTASSITGSGKLHVYTQDKTRSLPLTKHKNQLQMDQDLSSRADTLGPPRGMKEEQYFKVLAKARAVW